MKSDNLNISIMPKYFIVTKQIYYFCFITVIFSLIYHLHYFTFLVNLQNIVIC